MSHFPATRFLRKSEKLRGQFICLLLKLELPSYLRRETQHQKQQGSGKNDSLYRG